VVVPPYRGNRVATSESDLEQVERALGQPGAVASDHLRQQLQAALAAALRDGIDIDPLLYRVDVDEQAVDRVFATATGHDQVAEGLATLVWERTVRKLAGRATRHGRGTQLLRLIR